MGYNSFGAALTFDSNGNLHAGGLVHVSQPVVVGADKSLRYLHRLVASRTKLTFTCDDTHCPPPLYLTLSTQPLPQGRAATTESYFYDQMCAAAAIRPNTGTTIPGMRAST